MTSIDINQCSISIDYVYKQLQLKGLSTSVGDRLI